MSNLSSQEALNSIRARQGYMIAGQIATIGAITEQTAQTTSALKLVDETLHEIQNTIDVGLESVEFAITSLEINILESLADIKWYMHNIDDKLAQLINLIKFSSATKSDEYNEQGFILYRMEDYEKAKQQFTKSLDENPLNVHAHINLAFVGIKQDNLNASIASFERALQILETDYSYSSELNQEQLLKTKLFVKMNLADLLFKIDQVPQSQAYYSFVSSNSNDEVESATALYNSARCMYHIGLYQEVEAVFRQMIHDRMISMLAIAVGSEHFTKIRGRILQLIEEEAGDLKSTYKSLFDGTSKSEESQFYTAVSELTNSILTEEDYKKLFRPGVEVSYGKLISLYNWFNGLTKYFKNQKNFIEERTKQLNETKSIVIETDIPEIAEEFHSFVQNTIVNKYTNNIAAYINDELESDESKISDCDRVLSRAEKMLPKLLKYCVNYVHLEEVINFKVPSSLITGLSEESSIKIDQLSKNYL
jgi:tetratricopeptide (TPR) repeat protein